jgi:hypothetical protein
MKIAQGRAGFHGADAEAAMPRLRPTTPVFAKSFFSKYALRWLAVPRVSCRPLRAYSFHESMAPTASKWPVVRSAVPKTAPPPPSVPLNPTRVSGDYIDWSRFEAWENTPKTRYRLSREVDDEIDRGRFWSRQCLRSVLSVARPYTPASAFRLPEAPVRYGSAKRWAQAGLLPFVSCGSSPAKSQTCRLFVIGRQSGRTPHDGYRTGADRRRT